MELKIGDKIRITKSPYSWIRGGEGVIVEVRPPNREYHYKVYLYIKEEKGSFYYPVKDGEIEKIIPKGQQLLFSFMEQQ